MAKHHLEVEYTNKNESKLNLLDKLPYDSGLLKCMDALATCLLLSSHDDPDRKEAEQLFRAIYNINVNKYGEKHRLTLRAAANLGKYLFKPSQYLFLFNSVLLHHNIYYVIILLTTTSIS